MSGRVEVISTCTASIYSDVVKSLITEPAARVQSLARDFIFLRLHMLPAQESLLVKH